MKVKSKLKKISVLVVLLGCLQAAIAAGPAQTRSFTDMTGHAITIPANVTRIGDAWPANNEIVVMLGAGNKLVATSSVSQSLPWIKTIFPGFGKISAPFTAGDVNIEELLNARPQVVIVTTGGTRVVTASSSAMAQKINGVGIPTVTFYMTNFDELKQTVLLTGRLLGSDETRRAEEWVKYFDSKLAKISRVISTIPANRKPTILHVMGVSPIRVDGSGTIIDAWIQAVGGVNAARDVFGVVSTVSIEQVLRWNPDVIIVGTTEQDREAILGDAQWRRVKAVREGCVFVNPKGVYSWDRHDAEEALQIQWAAKTLYPEKFQSIDIAKETKEFYRTFFNYNLTDNQVKDILVPHSATRY
jgi:iron complex transport system substrate-binding protein